MRGRVGTMLAGALRDFRADWRSYAMTDLAYKLVAFAILGPAVSLLLRWMLSAAPEGVVADLDIPRFLLTTPVGVAALVLCGALLVAITALEASCLMAIAFARENGAALAARAALVFAAGRAGDVLRLTAHMVVRLLLGLAPFALALGLVYKGILGEHDINFYLARRPPELALAVGLAALVALVLAALLLRTIGRWALALPLVLFERVSPRAALGESARRVGADRRFVWVTLAAWAAAGLALAGFAGLVPELIGRPLAPWFAGGLAPMLLFIALLLLVWTALSLAAGIVNFSLFSLLVTRLYLEIGEPKDPRGAVARETAPSADELRRGRRLLAAGAALVAVVAVGGLVLLLLLAVPPRRPVLVIAHRGASFAAPENSLAAFRKAIEDHADFYELDVQETKDGEVVVVHDSDLMKVGGSATKIWEAVAAELRGVDIGSRSGPEFASERVPTLREALELVRGRDTKVIVELKSYGHDERLEERVAAIVEATGSQDACIFMSLDRAMVKKMRELRPNWISGALVAKALGDLSAIDADFLAVEARTATVRFVRRAHRAGKPVYVWTVNDPAWMMAALGRGVDGLITDRPDLAREVVGRYAAMSDAQRFLVAALVRLGARSEALASEDALRP